MHLHCWRAEARSKPTVICWSYKAIGRTVSCEAKLAYFSRVAHDDRERRVSRCSVVSDARRGLLGSMVEACSRSSAVSDSRRCSSIHRRCRLWASVVVVQLSAESARAELVFNVPVSLYIPFGHKIYECQPNMQL